MKKQIKDKTQKEIIDVLRAKKVLIEYRDHNIKEIHKLEKLAASETNKDIYDMIQRKIREGRSYISIQATEILQMSVEKLADKFKVHRTAVAYYWNQLNGIKF